MTYAVHIIKMNNFNLQPPPLWPRTDTLLSSLLSPPVFSLFFGGEGDSVNRQPSSHPQQNYCLATMVATMQEQQFIDVRKSFQYGGRAGVTDKQFGRKKNTVDFNRIPLLIWGI